MYLQKWSLIWLTAVEISQQSHNSPVIESRAVKYYSNKSSKSPLKNCPCSGISHSHKGGGSWEKGSKRRGKIFPQREPQAEDPAHPIWWPNCGREIKKQRLWAIKKCCWKFNHGYSIFKGSQPSPCNLLEQVAVLFLLQMLWILLVQRVGDGPWRRRATGAERWRSDLEWPLATRGGRQGKEQISI